jgi:hypothetical protein
VSGASFGPPLPSPTVEHVVGVQQVVAPAAVHVVAARAADDPVVAQVAEDHVVAVGVRG